MGEREHFNQLSVLIIDDSDIIREVIKAILENAQITRVHEARDGSSAFAILARQPVDLIICDIFMAPMHGLKFLEMVRSRQVPPAFAVVDGRPIPPDIPVIMITGKAMKALVHDADVEWSAILEKPINPDALLAEIARLAPAKTAATR